VLAAFGTLVRRLAGDAASAWATAATAALAAWSLALLWVAGVQDLWMMLWALAALHAWVRERRWLATAACALALLSKETACVLPAILLAWELLVARRGGRRSLGRLAPVAALTLAWAALHPRFGGRLWRHDVFESVADPTRVPAWQVPVKSALVLANLDTLPRPEGLAAALAAGLVAAALLAGLAWVRWPRAAAPPRAVTAPPPRGVAMFGIAWALLAWLPLLLPGLGFHAYYALFGALGGMLALATIVPRRRVPAIALVALLAIVGAMRTRTPSLDWGEATYQRRAGALLGAMRAGLLRLHPAFPPHARLFFVRVPDRVGFMTGDGPALRVWYRDPTLRAGFFSAYAPRRAGEAGGPDYFFRLDSLSGWVELRAGPEDVSTSLHANPRWITDHERLAGTFSIARDWPRAAGEYAKLAVAVPASADYAYDAAACFSQAEDDSAAMHWMRAAAQRPGASPEVLAGLRAAGLLPR